MKTCKRAIGVIAMVLVLVLNLCAGLSIAAAEAPTGTITVTNNPATTHVSINGKVYSAYRVFDLVQNEDHSAYAYTLNENFAGLFTSEAFTTAFSDAEVDESKTSTIYAFVSGLKQATAIEKFAAIVKGFVADKKIDATATATGANEKAVFSALPLGYYLVLGNAVPTEPANESDEVVTACILDTTTWNDATNSYTVEIQVKAGIPGIKKEIVKENETTEADALSIGDTESFCVTSSVPDLTGYTAYTFTMIDTMSKGLTFNNDVVVKIGAQPLSSTVYTVNTETVSDTGATRLTVNFNDFYSLIKNGGYQKGTAITFEYSATLNENAVVTEEGNPNEATIVYTRDPGTGDTQETDTAIVKVYTFELDLFKYTKAGAAEGGKTALAGAEFTLSKGDTPVAFVKDADTGVYRVAVDADTDTTNTVVSDEDGNIRVLGLGAGTYTLTETKAPDGYNKLEAPLTVTVKPIYDTEDQTKLSGLEIPQGAEYTALEENKGVRIEVENSTGTELPSTGGMGTTILYIVGGLLIAAAVIGFTVRKVANHG